MSNWLRLCLLVLTSNCYYLPTMFEYNYLNEDFFKCPLFRSIMFILLYLAGLCVGHFNDMGVRFWLKLLASSNITQFICIGNGALGIRPTYAAVCWCRTRFNSTRSHNYMPWPTCMRGYICCSIAFSTMGP